MGEPPLSATSQRRELIAAKVAPPLGGTCRRHQRYPQTSLAVAQSHTHARDLQDMWKGDVVPTENEPRIACPLCGTTYVLSSGEPRAALKREGFQGWVGGLARTSTAAEQATTLARYPAKISVPEGSNEPLVELDLRNLKTD